MLSATEYPNRLNAIQKMMLQWSEIHPYNASHVCLLRGLGDLERLRWAVKETFHKHDLGTVEIAAGGRRYRTEFTGELEVRAVAAEADRSAQLERLVADELNRPFARPRGCPMRFVIMPGQFDSHYLVTTYDHWTADSVSSRLILRQILARYLDRDLPERERELRAYDGTFRQAFSSHMGCQRVISAVSNVVGRVLRPCKVAQPAFGSVHDLATGYGFSTTSPDIVDRMRCCAKSLQVSVHDVILATLAQTMHHHLPRRALRDPRSRIALATIVDARRDASPDLQGQLGTFLTFHVVNLPGSAGGTLSDTIRQVSVQTSRLKATCGHLNSVVDMKLLGSIWPALTTRRRAAFVRNAFPLTAGVSNVVISENWFGAAGNDQVLDYFRASPTGPAVPLVLTPTTFLDRMNIGVSYRATAFSRDRVDALLDTFLECVEKLEPSAMVGRVPQRREPAAQAAATGQHVDNPVAA